jgi:protein SCO1/2
MPYLKSNNMLLRRGALKVLLSVLAMLLVATSAVADGFNDPGASFYGEQIRPKVSNQLDSQVLDKVGWTQNLNKQIPLNLTFKDDGGNAVTLQKYFQGKPVLVEMVYFYCPMLCSEVMKGTFRGLKDLSFRPGRDYQLVVVSVNPKEGPDIAADEKKKYLKEFGMEKEADGVHFLTGEDKNIKSLAKAIGFGYTYDPKTDQFAHPAGMVLTTPEGVIARYMSGVFFDPKDLRLGFLDAGRGKIGSPLDLIVLKCFHYDGQTGKYTFAIMDVLRVGGLVTVMLIGLLMVVLVRRDVARTKAQREEL